MREKTLKTDTKKRLAIIVLGKPRSGKSSVWCSLFNQMGLKSCKTKRLQLTASPGPANHSEWIEVALIYSSCTETEKKITSRLPRPLPDVVLCSAQYDRYEISTFDFLHQNGYDIRVLWLKPGAPKSGPASVSGDPDFVDLTLNTYKGNIVVKPGGSGMNDWRSKANAYYIRETILGWLHASF